MTSQTYVSLTGINRCISVRKRLPFPFLKEELGRCLGLTNNYGNVMCQWFLQKNVQVFPRRNIYKRASEEEITTYIKEHLRFFRLGSYFMAAVLSAASYSRGGFSLYLDVSARHVMVTGGSTFHLEPVTILSEG